MGGGHRKMKAGRWHDERARIAYKEGAPERAKWTGPFGSAHGQWPWGGAAAVSTNRHLTYHLLPGYMVRESGHGKMSWEVCIETQRGRSEKKWIWKVIWEVEESGYGK